MPSKASAIKAIAVFRPLQLGDLLCAVPALRAIRRAHPAARITLIGLPWASDFVRRLPYVDDFLEFPGLPGLSGRIPDLAGLPEFFAAARARHFDLAIQLHGSGILTNPLVAQLGAGRTAFSSPAAWCPDPERFLAWPGPLPEIRRLLALTALLGFPTCGEQLELPILADELRAFCQLRASLPVVGLATTELATVVRDGRTGCIDTDPAHLVDDMRRLIASPGLAAELGGAARRAAVERFDIRRFVADWLAVLRDVTQ